MKATLALAGAFLMLSLTACGTLPQSPASSRLPMQQPYRLVLVRPDIQVRELTADGALSFRVEWADTARAALAEQVQRALAARTGATVQVLGSEQAGADPAIVAELHLRHDALGKMFPRPQTVGKSLGDAAIKVGADTRSELLFILHADYTLRSAGRKAVVGVGMVGCALLEAAATGSVGDFCSNPDAGDESAFASLLDAKSGEVLWTGIGPSGFGDLRDAKKAQKLARALTKKLPDLKPVGQ